VGFLVGYFEFVLLPSIIAVEQKLVAYDIYPGWGSAPMGSDEQMKVQYVLVHSELILFSKRNSTSEQNTVFPSIYQRPTFDIGLR